jgi:hypothetical protein
MSCCTSSPLQAMGTSSLILLCPCTDTMQPP